MRNQITTACSSLSLLLCLSACGEAAAGAASQGQPPVVPQVTVTGSVAGESFVNAKALGMILTTGGIPTLFIANRDFDCSSFLGEYLADSKMLALVVGQGVCDSGTGRCLAENALGPGTYSVSTNPFQIQPVPQADIEFQALDARCRVTSAKTSNVGSTIALVQAENKVYGRYRGSFDATFGSDHISGEFDTYLCPLPELTSAVCK
jgi:hypothetical protein